jgi:hypothetical protein
MIEYYFNLHFKVNLKIFILVLPLFWGNLISAVITVYWDHKSPQTAFALEEIQKSLLKRGYRATESDLTNLPDAKDSYRIVLVPLSETKIVDILKMQGKQPSNDLKHEGFSIRVTSDNTQTAYWVIGFDEAGVMYGGLELAEIIGVGDLKDVTEIDQNPYMALRGTKFNCPLDVRTPSYTDPCDAAQNNIIEMWNFDFWKEYIDNLARYRFNFVSLWSLHPFPSLVKVPEYPEIALNDVQKSTVQWKEFYSLNGVGFDAPEIINNVKILKKMTIAEKIAFWRKVMAYGKDRNIEFFFITWNIFVNGTYGKYGITENIANPTTVDYFRQSVKQMFLTYPDLKGIGLTTGENMPGATFQEKEDWAFNTYAQGVLDAVKEQPGRKIIFIHRQHQTGALEIAKRFQSLIDDKDVEFIFSFKYAQAHVYSSTTQSFHYNFVKDIKSKGNLKTIWTLRNDDIYYFRWGAPDFVRDFIKNIPYDVSRGYYYGSDQYIWGREFLSLEPENPRQIEIVKHWYHWMIWGRLGYNPNMSNDRFIQILQDHFPSVSGKALFNAWQEASMIYPKTTGFHWGALDFQWYIEASKSRSAPAQTPSGFHDVNRFISLKPNPATGYISIPQYVKSMVSGNKIAATTPIEISDQINSHADRALKLLDNMSSNGSRELRQTLDDIRTIAYLGKYYANKIKGATELALFRETFKIKHQTAVINYLIQAASFWRKYASIALSQYKNPLWTNRVGFVDWKDIFNYVLYDLTTVGGNHNLPSIVSTPGGMILEAEEAVTNIAEKSTGISGYTGSGYLDFQGSGDVPVVEWTYDAERDGNYILEIRYSVGGQDSYPSLLKINGNNAGNFVFWRSGNTSSWVWDRKTVALKKGKNTIRLIPTGSPLIDHLNIFYGGSY